MITSEIAELTPLTENILPQGSLRDSETGQLPEGEFFRKVRKGGQKGKINNHATAILELIR